MREKVKFSDRDTDIERDKERLRNIDRESDRLIQSDHKDWQTNKQTRQTEKVGEKN